MSQANCQMANWKPLKKAPFFVDHEEKRLMRLVDKYGDIIECKITGSNSGISLNHSMAHSVHVQM